MKSSYSHSIVMMFISVVTALVADGCGGAPVQPTAPVSAADVPPEVTGFTYLLEPARGRNPTTNAVNQALQSGLVSAGLNVATGRDQTHDLVARVSVMLTEEKSLMQVRVNGKVKRSYKVGVILAILSGGQIVDQFTTEFSASEGEVTEEEVRPVVAALVHSRKVAGLGHSRKQQAEAAKAADEEQKKQDAEQQDEAAWANAGIVQCKQPAKLDSCKAVQGYLVEHAKGAHADEARQVLADAQPALEKLQKDENEWQASGFKSCKQEPSKDSCLGVEIYNTKHAAGLHSEEAQRLLKALDKSGQ